MLPLTIFPRFNFHTAHFLAAADYSYNTFSGGDYEFENKAEHTNFMY
jgi:hypothetical protein